MAKFPRNDVQPDPLVAQVLDIHSSNPWTIQVPDQNAVSFLDEWDKEFGYLVGHYDAGATRGKVLLPTEFIAQRKINQESWIVAPMIVTTQGIGTTYYISLFKFDAVPSRVILLDSYLIGERVNISQLRWRDDTSIEVSYLKHGVSQTMEDTPKQSHSLMLARVGYSLHMQ